MANLNTHRPGLVQEAFAPAKVKRLADTLEIHVTPEHDRSLNGAEIERGVLSRQ